MLCGCQSQLTYIILYNVWSQSIDGVRFYPDKELMSVIDEIMTSKIYGIGIRI